MWKLTITQKKPSEYSAYPSTHSVEYRNEKLEMLAAMVVNVASCGEAHETEYKIERIGEED